MPPGCLLLALPVRPSDPAHPRIPLGRGDDTFGDVTMLRNIPGRREELASSRGLSGGYYAGNSPEGRQETGGQERGSPVCSPRISRDKTTVKMGAELFTVSANETATFFRLTRPKTTVANLEMSRKWHHTSVHL